MAATRIDCDIHPAVGGTRTTLLPYLDDHWKEQVVSRAIDGLDLNSYPPNSTRSLLGHLDGVRFVCQSRRNSSLLPQGRREMRRASKAGRPPQ